MYTQRIELVEQKGTKRSLCGLHTIMSCMVLLVSFSAPSSGARHHYHKHRSHHYGEDDDGYHISLSPVYSPAFSEPPSNTTSCANPVSSSAPSQPLSSFSLPPSTAPSADDALSPVPSLPPSTNLSRDSAFSPTPSLPPSTNLSRDSAFSSAPSLPPSTSLSGDSAPYLPPPALSQFPSTNLSGVPSPSLPPSYFSPPPSTTPSADGDFSPVPYLPPSTNLSGDSAFSPAPSLPPSTSSGSRTFNIRDFNAVGDGCSDDTLAFRSAWNAACSTYSAVLLVPSDSSFIINSTIFSGPCKPGLIFQIDGVLMPPDGPDLWPESDSRKQWLVFYRVDGMTLRGSGTIEGNGEGWWNLPCKPHRGPNGRTLQGPCDSPALIRFFMSNNVSVMDLRIENSPQFHIKFDGCNEVLIDRLSISSPATSPNTDGIHIEGTSSVAIYNSIISNGDDCISIGPGCRGVYVENVTCGPSHGISIGSLGVHNSEACVSEITVRNSTIRNSDNGLRIKTWQGGMGSVTNVLFDSISMENVRNCIIVDQYYCLTKPCSNQSSAVSVSGVSYTDIKGTYDPTAGPPVHFACSDGVPCTNITMSDVELLPFEGEMVDDPFCWNAYGSIQTLTIPPMDCLQEGEPLSLNEKWTSMC